MRLKHRSPSDREILEALSSGKRVSELAADKKLPWSNGRVSLYCQRLRTKLGIQTTEQLMFVYGQLTTEHSYSDLFDEVGRWKLDYKLNAKTKRV
jgi:DNA-binding NarL/FixJ family response regulator